LRCAVGEFFVCNSSFRGLHRHTGHDFFIPGCGNNIAVGIKPLDAEKWLKALREELGFSNPTCAKVRAVMAFASLWARVMEAMLKPGCTECAESRVER